MSDMKSKRPRARRVLFDWRYVKEESRRSYRLAFILFWSVLLCLFFHRHVIGVGIIAERSMLPLLTQDSWFLVNKYAYHFTAPKRGDIVVVRWGMVEDITHLEAERYVKRIVVLPGETLQIRNGRLFINDHELREPYVNDGTYPDLGPVTLGPSMYFVMGDNRSESLDSRHFGPVTKDRIEGKIDPTKWFPLW